MGLKDGKISRDGSADFPRLALSQLSSWLLDLALFIQTPLKMLRFRSHLIEAKSAKPDYAAAGHAASPLVRASLTLEASRLDPRTTDLRSSDTVRLHVQTAEIGKRDDLLHLNLAQN